MPRGSSRFTNAMLPYNRGTLRRIRTLTTPQFFCFFLVVFEKWSSLIECVQFLVMPGMILLRPLPSYYTSHGRVARHTDLARAQLFRQGGAWTSSGIRAWLWRRRSTSAGADAQPSAYRGDQFFSNHHCAVYWMATVATCGDAARQPLVARPPKCVPRLSEVNATSLSPASPRNNILDTVPRGLGSQGSGQIICGLVPCSCRSSV